MVNPCALNRLLHGTRIDCRYQTSIIDEKERLRRALPDRVADLFLSSPFMTDRLYDL